MSWERKKEPSVAYQRRQTCENPLKEENAGRDQQKTTTVIATGLGGIAFPLYFFHLLQL